MPVSTESDENIIIAKAPSPQGKGATLLIISAIYEKFPMIIE